MDIRESHEMMFQTWWLVGEGRLEEAIALYRVRLQHSPDNAEIKRQLAANLSHLGHLEEALQLSREVVETNPNEAFYRLNLAKYLYQSGKVQEAVIELERAVRDEEEPDCCGATRTLARIYREQGKTEEAMTLLKRITGDNFSPEAAFLLKDIFLEQGKITDAIEVLRCAARAFPECRQVLWEFGNALAKNGQMEEARQYWRTVVDMPFRYPHIRGELPAWLKDPYSPMRPVDDVVADARKALDETSV